MVTCEFCGRRLKNAQALRAHLGHCPQRRARQSAEPTGSRPGSQAAYRQPGSLKAAGSEPRPGGVAEPVLDELQAERAKLDLRRVKGEHHRLDEEERERGRHRREEQEAARRERIEQELAREQARLEAEERQAREAAEAERQRQRRKIIQRTKDHVDSAYAEGLIRVPEDVRGAMLAEVEQVLAGMPVDELSFSEVARYAEGIREKHYRPVVEAHRRQEEAERRRAAAKAHLAAHGQRYAEDRLDAEGIQGFARLGITLGFGSTLDRELDGTESTRDVEELVEGLLAPEIKRVRREAEERRRQEAESERQRRKQERTFKQLARDRQERAATARERAEDARLTANRQRLASDGYYHVLRILNNENELPAGERFRLALEVKEELLNELDGDEAQDEVEDLVDEILDEELGEE